MASAFGSLNGSGPQQVWAELRYIDYDTATRKSTWLVQLRYYGNGYGSWSGSTWSWSITGGVSKSGSFQVTSGEAYNTYETLYSAYIEKQHNTDGYLSAFTITGSINTDHTSV